MCSKILVITNSYPNQHKPYAAMYIKRHIQLHEEAGLQVTVLSPNDSRRGGIKSVWKYIRFLRQVLQALIFLKFDLIHAHWPLPSGLIGLVISCLRQKPLVITSHGRFVDNFQTQHWLVKIMVRNTLRKANMIIAVGQQHRHNVIEIAGLSSSNVACISMGVWLEQSSLNKAVTRENLGVNLEDNVIVFIGNWLYRKGVDILLESAAILQIKGQQFKLVIGGQGEENQNILKMIDELNLSNITDVIGAVLPKDVMVWFTAADIVVVPSRTEPFGLVAIEAMACGTPVVASAVGGLVETIQHSENGFLFPVGDYIALAEQLECLLNDEEIRRSVIKAGYRTAAKHDMRLKADQVKQIYEQLLSE